MKLLNLQRLTFAGIAALGVAGLASMTASCGSDTAAPGDGGVTGTGGRTTDSGTGSGGATSGSGGAASTPSLVNHTFTTSTQGWVINSYCEPANLGGVAMPDAGAAACGGTPAPTATVELAEGMPPGSLKVTVRYTAYNQYVDATFDPPAPGIDLTGRVLKAQVQLLSASAPFTGGVQMHASTGMLYTYGNNAGMALTAAGAWVPLQFPLNSVTVAGFDPATVRQIGVQFYSGMPAVAGTAYTPVDAVFLIDNVTD